jgi:hypothetical protein
MRDCVEHAISADLVAGHCAGAVAKTVAVYGREIFGFVTAALGEPRIGREAYARFVASLGDELPRFAWRCRLRTFAYHVACRELRRMRERLGSALVTISVETERAWRAPLRRSLLAVVGLVRRRLGPEDREFLVLHFDRGFDWREIALTFLGEHATERELAAKSDELHHRLRVLRMQIEQLTGRASWRSDRMA